MRRAGGLDGARVVPKVSTGYPWSVRLRSANRVALPLHAANIPLATRVCMLWLTMFASPVDAELDKHIDAQFHGE